MSRRPGPGRVPCVGAVVPTTRGRLLMILRGREPAQGRWSLPGGRVEPGETDEQATVREVREETGLEVVVVGDAVGEVDLPTVGGGVAEVVDLPCRLAPGADPAAVRGRGRRSRRRLVHPGRGARGWTAHPGWWTPWRPGAFCPSMTS